MRYILFDLKFLIHNLPFTRSTHVKLNIILGLNLRDISLNFKFFIHYLSYTRCTYIRLSNFLGLHWRNIYFNIKPFISLSCAWSTYVELLRLLLQRSFNQTCFILQRLWEIITSRRTTDVEFFIRCIENILSWAVLASLGVDLFIGSINVIILVEGIGVASGFFSGLFDDNLICFIWVTFMFIFIVLVVLVILAWKIIVTIPLFNILNISAVLRILPNVISNSPLWFINLILFKRFELFYLRLLLRWGLVSKLRLRLRKIVVLRLGLKWILKLNSKVRL